MQRPNWINTQEYPFVSKYLKHADGNIHYIDEGKGDVIVFVHGTPEWSFAYRNVIKTLSRQYRCIAIDHLGFGLSDKPQQADYSVKAHAERLRLSIAQLQLKNVVLVGGDFGGAMIIDYAIHHPESVKAIVLWNTWMWDVMQDKHFSGPAKMIHTWFGKFMYQKLNAPVNFIMPQAYGNKKKLTKEIHRHYKMPLQNSANRIGTYTIAEQLKDAGAWWDTLWKLLDRVEHKPVLFLWGMKDKFIPPYILEKWKKRLPYAKVIELQDAGHFVAEEEPEIFAQEIKKLIF